MHYLSNIKYKKFAVRGVMVTWSRFSALLRICPLCHFRSDTADEYRKEPRNKSSKEMFCTILGQGIKVQCPGAGLAVYCG